MGAGRKREKPQSRFSGVFSAPVKQKLPLNSEPQAFQQDGTTDPTTT